MLTFVAFLTNSNSNSKQSLFFGGLQQQTSDCLEHALVVARTTVSITENHVRTTYLSSLLFGEKRNLISETLSQMPEKDRISCCHKLILFIEDNVNAYVRK